MITEDSTYPYTPSNGSTYATANKVLYLANKYQGTASTSCFSQSVCGLNPSLQRANAAKGGAGA